MKNKLIKFKWLLIPAVGIICACSVFLKPSQSPAGTREEAETFLKTVVHESLLEYSHVEVASRNNIKKIQAESREYLGLCILKDQRLLNGGIRAEISVDYPFVQGETVRYSWEFMLPSDFKTDPKNRWWVIGQWHDQPDTGKGENWDNFKLHSPTVAIGLGELNGKTGIGFSYGLTRDEHQQIKSDPYYIERGKWCKISAVIHWSEKEEGKISFYINGSENPVFEATGPNMNNNFRHYLKIGMYRHPKINSDNWIYVDGLNISKEK